MSASSDRVPVHRDRRRPGEPSAAAERARIGLQAEVARLAIEAIRLASELGETVRQLEEAQLESALAADDRSRELARSAIRQAGR